MSNNTCYIINPFAGLICRICMKRILPDSVGGYSRGIHYHEKNSTQNHVPKLTSTVRNDITKAMEMNFIRIARSLFHTSIQDNNHQIEDILSDYLEVPKLCYVCQHPNCINDTHIYASKNFHKCHYIHCNQEVYAYVPKHWTKGNPKCILDPYDISIKDNFCPMFWEILQRTQQTQNEVNNTISTTMITFPNHISQDEEVSGIQQLTNNLLQKRQQLNDTSTTNINITILPETEANSWIRRVGWDVHLKGLSIDFLLQLSKPVSDEEFTLQRFIKIYDLLMKTSIYLYKKETEPSGNVRWSMNRNSKDNLAKIPFTDIHDPTWVKYSTVMHQVISVLFRMVSLYQNDTQEYINQLPTFYWFATQQVLYDDFIRYITAAGYENEGNDTIASQKCLKLIISLFNHKIESNPYHSIVLTVLAIDSIRNDGTFEGYTITRQKYPALIKIVKILVYRLSYDEDISTNGVLPIDSKLLSIINKYMEQFMYYESNSPISWIYNSFNYATAIQYTEFSLPKISWDNDNSTVFCDDIALNMMDLKSKVIPKMVSELKKLLKRLILVNDTCAWDTGPKYPDIIYDDPHNNHRNFNFLKHRSNTHWVRDGELFVYNNMKKHHPHQWIEGTTINLHTYTSYEHIRKEFLSLLLFSVHITYGQPSRGTEIVDVRFSNTNTLRNLFYDKETSMMYIFTKYHKGFNHTNTEKNICRFVPTIITQITVRYLWLVLPFITMIDGMINNNSYISNYLFTKKVTCSNHDGHGDDVFQSKDLTHTLCEKFMKYINTRITINSWRHIAIAIVEKYLKISISNEELDDDDYDYQCGHTPNVASLVYANIKTLPKVSTQSFFSYRRISQRWHNLLGINNLDQIHNNVLQLDNNSSIEISALEYQVKYQRDLRLDNLLTKFQPSEVLKVFFNDDNATFRGKQEHVLRAIQKQIPNILHIAGTGEGKSLSFMLIGFYADGGTTIVIAPLVSLKLDFISRCSTNGIVCQEWLSSSDINVFCSSVALIFVTPESSLSIKFKSLVQRLKRLHLLDRIIFDECHLYLDCDSNFRERMMQVATFYNQQLGIQRVYLTATLPPNQECTLKTLMDIPNDKVMTFRSSTRRNNISYNVVTVHTHDGCMNIIKQEISNLSKIDQKVIVYCRTIQEITEVANDLQCYKYYHDYDNKDIEYEQWKISTGIQIIVATSSLGAGIDIPNIYLIFMYGITKSLSDLVQATGRSGRNGQPSRAIILDYCRNKYYVVNDEIKLFLDTYDCRRIIIDRHMDQSYKVPRCTESNCCSLCDNCCFLSQDSHEDIDIAVDDNNTTNPVNDSIAMNRNIIDHNITIDSTGISQVSDVTDSISLNRITTDRNFCIDNTCVNQNSDNNIQINSASNVPPDNYSTELFLK